MLIEDKYIDFRALHAFVKMIVALRVIHAILIPYIQLPALYGGAPNDRQDFSVFHHAVNSISRLTEHLAASAPLSQSQRFKICLLILSVAHTIRQCLCCSLTRQSFPRVQHTHATFKIPDTPSHKRAEPEGPNRRRVSYFALVSVGSFRARNGAIADRQAPI
jgi:hypothetical protein